MPYLQKDDIRLRYEITGKGYPLLLLAPGGMRSAISFWGASPWNPITAFSNDFMVIAMDQRNAGESTAPITASDGWHTYTADQIALLDHLDIEKCHLMGGCIGGPYCFGLINAAPGRFSAAIIQQTIGIDNNREAFYDMFDSWADDLKPLHPEVEDAAWRSFRSNLYDREFLLNVDRDFVRQCELPLLVLLGKDLYHPETISREIVHLARNAMLIEDWKSNPEETAKAALAFLKESLDSTVHETRE